MADPGTEIRNGRLHHRGAVEEQKYNRN